MTFIIRLTVAADGGVNGIVERPTTGEKHRFQGADALGVVVAQMARKAALITALLALIASAATSPSAAQTATHTFTATALPTATRTATATFTSTNVPPTATRTLTFTATALPTATRSSTATFTATSVPPTSTRTATFTSTALPTATRSSTATFTATSVPPTATRTATFTSTALPPATRTSTATFTSTGNPITPTPTAPIPSGLSISDVSIVEGNEGTRSAVFAVRLRGQATYPVRVSAKTVDGTATVADSDYDALTTALVFNARESQQTISVTIRGDRFVETTETFSVVLGAAVGAPITDATGIGTILSDEELTVGVPELVPANPATAPDDLTSLILRWAHPDRWRALKTVDLRLRDDDRPVLWVRFDEAANTLAVCAADGGCGVGVAPETGAPIAGDTATFYPAESAVRGSGPTGPSVDLIFTFSLARSLAGRILQVETAASEDSGEQQGFLPIASLQVIDTSPSGSTDGDGCAIDAARGRRRQGWAMHGLGLLALVGLATRCRRGQVR